MLTWNKTKQNSIISKFLRKTGIWFHFGPSLQYFHVDVVWMLFRFWQPNIFVRFRKTFWIRRCLSTILNLDCTNFTSLTSLSTIYQVTMVTRSATVTLPAESIWLLSRGIYLRRSATSVEIYQTTLWAQNHFVMGWDWEQAGWKSERVKCAGLFLASKQLPGNQCENNKLSCQTMK